jgi:iron complex transport system ATP-binding protein
MKDGAIVAEGPPWDVIDAERVERVFGLACEVVADPVSNTPLIVPRGRHHTGERVREVHGQEPRVSGAPSG